MNYEGKYLRFRDVAFALHPYQRPYPPLWYPTVNPETIPWIAREGMSTVYGFSFLSWHARGHARASSRPTSGSGRSTATPHGA